VPGFGRLHRINGQGADGVNCELFDFLLGHKMIARRRISSRFQGGDFTQAAQIPFGVAIFGSEEGLN
jgi:hypothetical protein